MMHTLSQRILAAPVFQMETEQRYFSFVVKTEFEASGHRFDQCGVAIYLDSENRLKASVDYENERYQHFGRVMSRQNKEMSHTILISFYTFQLYFFDKQVLQ